VVFVTVYDSMYLDFGQLIEMNSAQLTSQQINDWQSNG